MKNKYILTAISAALLFLNPSCKDEQRCSIHPEAFRFSLIDSETSQDLLYSGIYNKEDIAIYYFYNGEQHYLLVNSDTNPGNGLHEMVSAQLPMISLTGRSDLFYLRLSQAETDTLFVTVERETREDCDYHPYTSVKHNWKDIPVTGGKSFILYK